MEDSEKKLLDNIFNFAEGYLNLSLSKLDLQDASFDEQVEYRKSLCSDCEELKKCVYCGCTYPDRLYTTKTCNKGERFPDLMSPEMWQQFKNDKSN